MFDYSTANGRPNGIVFHYTDNATNYSARSEANYKINGGWKNAFVHTFIDHNTILNIHNTNYGSWGAGPMANHRFVQFELVSARNATEFAQSINNAAWYTAYICHMYNLPLTLAGQHYGIGGIWTHHDVTNYLGGTDHTDPDAYLKKWGYSLPQFLDLVKAYTATQHFQDTILKQTSVDYTALINQAKRNDGMFRNAPYNVHGASLAGYAKSYNGQGLQAVAEAQTQSGTWVKVKLPSGAYVWMDKRGISKYARIKSQKNVNYPVKVQQTKRNDMMFVNSPYGVLGSKRYQYAKAVNGQMLTAVKEAVVSDGNLTWIQMKLANNTLVWVDKRAVHAYDTLSNQHAVAYDASLSKISKNDGLFKSKPYNVVGSSLYAMASKYRNQDVSVIAEATSGSTTWAQVRLHNGQTVWVNKATLHIYPRISHQVSANYHAILSHEGRNDGLFQNAPYGTKGSKLYAMAKKYHGQDVTVKKTGTVGSEKWAYITLKNGANVWVSAKCLKNYPAATAVNTTQYAAKLLKGARNDALFQNGPYSTYGAKQYASVSRFANQQVNVLKEVMVNGVHWLQAKLTSGQTIWVDKKLVSAYPHVTITSTKSHQAIIATVRANDGLFANGPYNTANSKLFAMAKKYQGQRVTVIQTGTVSGVEWAQIQFSNGHKYWIDAGCLRSVANLTITSNTQKSAKITTAKNNDGLFSNNPYGINGSKLYGYAKSYLNQPVTILKEGTTPSATWAQIRLANKAIVWIDKRLLTVDTGYQVVNTNQYKGQVNTTNSNDAVFANAPYGCVGARNIGSLRNYNGQLLLVKKEAVANKVHWVYVHFANGVEGWIDKSKLILQQSLSDNSAALYQTALKQGNSRDYLLNQVGGTAVVALSGLANQRVSVLDFQTVSGVNWAKVCLANGTAGWLDQRLLAKSATNNFGMNLTALSATQRSFALAVAQAAIKVGKQYGVYPSIILAQAAGETGWGTSKLATAANNLFGIKADSTWQGATYVVASPEVENGKTVMRNSTFRKYATLKDSVADYALKLTGSVLYVKALRGNSSNAINACQDLSEWATDPHYVTTLQTRIKNYAMSALDNL
ncbi:GW dipeptide domain-containing protein [Lacticaseibacillus manihotivorans]|nr:GW dipeptide domain-containing protein [Lacticaseibacillus manihotivorans]